MQESFVSLDPETWTARINYYKITSTIIITLGNHIKTLKGLNIFLRANWPWSRIPHPISWSAAKQSHVLFDFRNYDVTVLIIKLF